LATLTQICDAPVRQLCDPWAGRLCASGLETDSPCAGLVLGASVWTELDLFLFVDFNHHVVTLGFHQSTLKHK